MTVSLFSGLVIFSFVSAFTPGPNNLLALASGANFGYRKTLPHIIGVCVGFFIMLLVMGAGLGTLFIRYPVVQLILRYVAFSYLVYLAFRIATASGFGSTSAREKPITFLGSVAFQWVNPKAWIAALTLVSTFTIPHSYWQSLGIACLVNTHLAFLAVSAWALFGKVVKKWLSRPIILRIFNIGMALLLVGSVIPALFS